MTAALWIVGIAIHIGLDLLARALAPSADAVNASSVLLFIAVSLGVQGLVTMQRARSLPGADPFKPARATVVDADRP
jgi:hypothetical protein